MNGQFPEGMFSLGDLLQMGSANHPMMWNQQPDAQYPGGGSMLTPFPASDNPQQGFSGIPPVPNALPMQMTGMPAVTNGGFATPPGVPPVAAGVPGAVTPDSMYPGGLPNSPMPTSASPPVMAGPGANAGGGSLGSMLRGMQVPPGPAPQRVSTPRAPTITPPGTDNLMGLLRLLAMGGGGARG